MKGKAIILVFALVTILALVGCGHVRTYTVEKDRVDQYLGEGNSGYMGGATQPGQPIQARKLTRTTYVTEIELGSSGKSSKKTTPVVSAPAVEESKEEATVKAEATATVPAEVKSAVTSYTVQDNDTLQKISLKVYGSMKNWYKIYEANKDKLKTPDRIYKGQVLIIP